ncbi:MAG: hypothetical protein ABFD70_02840 [Syntrophaceae bacterium]|nr:hypothetical protein [Deltaproteobacteria bacterium]
MHDLWNAVSTNSVLEPILPILTPGTCLVGGCVRDLLLGRPTTDFDLVTFSDVWDLTGRIGAVLGGKAFWLDRERQVARVALKRGALTVDVSPPRGPDIASDVSERDITINAMALDARERRFIDPLQGMEDLDHGIIRLIAEKNLLDDPLRGLRCLRFAVTLGFTLSGETGALVRAHAGLIRGVTPERVKQEFLKSLESPRGGAFFGLLAETGYVHELFSSGTREGFPVDGDGLNRALDVSAWLDELLCHANELLPGIGDLFSQELEHGLSRAAALRLAAFLAGITAVPGIGPLCRRLSLSSRAARLVGDSISGHLAVLALAGKEHPDRRDMHLILRDYPGSVPEMLILAAASSGDARDTCERLWAYYLGEFLPQQETPLVTGDDIMTVFALGQGPRIGECLEQVETARASGLVSSREDAIEYLRRIISEHGAA